jgi:hypothetical protein
MHHVTVRFGSLPLHVAHFLYLGVLSIFCSPCLQRFYVSRLQTSFVLHGPYGFTADSKVEVFRQFRTPPAPSRVHVSSFLPYLPPDSILSARVALPQSLNFVRLGKVCRWESRRYHRV